MKKLYFRIFLFLLPVLAFIVVVPVDKRMKYQELKDDCFNHGIWIHDRLFHNEKPVDVLFLGSSHTINGVNDSLIEYMLGDSLHIVNLGYCRLGRNLDYVLLKEAELAKDLKYVVIEVREKENRYSHPVFANLSGTKDVLLSYPFFNPDILKDSYRSVLYKLQLWQDLSFGRITAVPFNKNDFGHTASAGLLSAGEAEMLRNREIKERSKNSLSSWFYNTFPRHYLLRMVNFCKTRNIRFCFLFLPSYASDRREPEEAEWYREKGALFIPPEALLQNAGYWYDKEHLNKSGAEALSVWMAASLEAWMRGDK